MSVFVFFSMLFILWYVLMVIWDNFQDRHVAIAQLCVDCNQQSGFQKATTKVKIVKQSLFFLIVTVVLFAELIYLGFAVRHDTFIVPTAALIIWNLYHLIRGMMGKRKGHKHNLDTLEGATAHLEEVKLRYAKGVRRVFLNIFRIAYFAYMIAMVIFF